MPDEATEGAIRAFTGSADNRCFACGPGNPHGLHLHFGREGEVVVANFTPFPWTEGWHEVVHGGILATVLDEAMAYTLFLRGVEGVTARMEVRYRLPVRRGDEIRVEARLVRERKRLADIEARLLRDGDVVAEASGRFVVVGPVDLRRIAARHE